MDDIQSLGVIYINHNFATESEARRALKETDARGAMYSPDFVTFGSNGKYALKRGNLSLVSGNAIVLPPVRGIFFAIAVNGTFGIRLMRYAVSADRGALTQSPKTKKYMSQNSPEAYSSKGSCVSGGVKFSAGQNMPCTTTNNQPRQYPRHNSNLGKNFRDDAVTYCE